MAKNANGKTRAAAAAKAAKKTAKKKAAFSGPKRDENLRVGMKKKNTLPHVFVTDGTTDNVFLVYGDSVGFHQISRKKVILQASNHTWEQPARIQNKGNDRLEITATCRVTTSARKKKLTSDGDDDLTVTIYLDPDTTNEESTEVYFPDVPYDA